MSAAHPPDGKPRRRARGSLSQEEIVNTAIALVERDGVDGLSMTGLARALDAGAMSIYWYFRNKEDLLLAMADRAFLDLASRLPLVTGGQWDAEVIRVTTGIHRQLRRNSLYLQLCRAHPRSIVLRPTVMPALAPLLELQLQILQQASLSTSEAMRVVTLLGAFARGFALMQIGAEEDQNHQRPERALQESVEHLSPAKFPMLRAASDVGAAVSVSDKSFRDGVQLMVAGLRAEIERPRAAP